MTEGTFGGLLITTKMVKQTFINYPLPPLAVAPKWLKKLADLIAHIKSFSDDSVTDMQRVDFLKKMFDITDGRIVERANGTVVETYNCQFISRPRVIDGKIKQINTRNWLADERDSRVVDWLKETLSPELFDIFRNEKNHLALDYIYNLLADLANSMINRVGFDDVEKLYSRYEDIYLLWIRPPVAGGGQ